MNKLILLKNLLLDILFPKFCVNCNKEGKYICNSCNLFISENALICPICNKGSFFGQTHKSCKKKYELDGLVSIWDYDGVIKMAIKKAKYSGVFDILNEMVEKSFFIISNEKRFDSFLSFLSNNDFDIFYVPIHKKKEKKSGFNHSKIIAKKFGEVFNKKPENFIIKKVNSKSQTKLKKDERVKNVKDTFFIKQDLNNFKKVILIDDIFTSGATMRECSNAIKKAGVKEVWGFTLARTI